MATTVDRERRTVTIDGKVYRPSKRLFDLIAFMAHRPGVVRSRAEIMDALDMHRDMEATTVDTAVKRVRKMGIKDILTSYAIGYYWRE